MEYATFDSHYQQDSPPWETGQPQPAVVSLAEQGQFTGQVLDVGCGTGENALHLAAYGHPVLGIDGAATAIHRARDNAHRRDLHAQFLVADAFNLTALELTFDTVLDSAFLHIPGNTAARRRTYTDQLAAVLTSGGWAHLLQISEKVTEHPSLTSAEILNAFDDKWTDAKIQEATYMVTSDELPAWLVSIQRR